MSSLTPTYSACSTFSSDLKHCVKCESVSYCYPTCQPTHRKTNKDDCALAPVLQGLDSLFPAGETPKRSDSKPFTAIYFNNYLHDRPEKDTFSILVDLFKMEQDEVYLFEGYLMEGTIYKGEMAWKKAFHEFLSRAQDIEGYLPPWWTPNKATECILFGLRDNDFNLECAQEKADIQKTRDNQQMPINLHESAGKVYERGLAGLKGDIMLAMMVCMEAGLSCTAAIDFISDKVYIVEERNHPLPAMDQPPKACSNCWTASTDLKRCARCKTTAYCNRDCQHAHWKTHKEACSAFANSPSGDKNPFTAISNGTFLHDRSEKQTFQLVIDAVRMRQEDMYNIESVAMKGSIYDGASSSEGVLREFLVKAKEVTGFLPSWWTDASTEACVQFGLHDDDFSLGDAQKKADIIETWKDERMPMKLRMLAEKVYGSAPGGVKGDQMLALMASSEAGTGPQYMTGINMAPAFGRNSRG
ncbi:hypothetical protein PRZ48_008398 [Zasmidium cellare]|uniref:MYND-type domain-containing protein n=1 Tax=Zasmidium cellare TaxID=395010 RepID=A0ABR0EFE7_ZASCE|nr:hypothetical protein PRZ48_008398 [Zasmidium cellare]